MATTATGQLAAAGVREAVQKQRGALYYAWLVLEKGMPAKEALEKAKAAGIGAKANFSFDERWDAGLGAQYIGKRRFVAGNTVAGEGGHSADVYMPSFWLPYSPNQRRPFQTVRLPGKEPSRPGPISRSLAVPAGVPSEIHSGEPKVPILKRR